MVIDKVHGLQATGLSLNERFTMLAATTEPRARMPRRRPSTGPFFNQNFANNRNIIEQIARRLEQQAKRQSLRQRLGVSPGALRRFGSESSLPGLRRSNSFGNLSQRGIKSRITWRQSNGNLNRSASFGNLSRGVWRRRAGGSRTLRGRFRGGVNFGRIGLRPARGYGGLRGARGGPRGARGGPRGARGGPRGARGGAAGVATGRGGGAGAGAGRGGRGAGAAGAQRARRGAARGRGRGGISRNQAPKPVPTKEELDLEIDQYMAGTKSSLDADLDSYMKNAMDLE